MIEATTPLADSASALKFSSPTQRIGKLSAKRPFWLAVLVFLVCAIGGAADRALSLPAHAPGVESQQAPAAHDGQHDFDFSFGTWKIHVSRLLKPLTGSSTWTEYEGTGVCRKVWSGRANLLEVELDGAGGHIEALGIRLYNTEARQWSLNWTNSGQGILQSPSIGEFKNGRGDFFDQEPFNGRAILARGSFSEIAADSSYFEQAFSDDGGKTWETNWKMTFTRIKDGSAVTQ
jgi:hypothetical protein